MRSNATTMQSPSSNVIGCAISWAERRFRSSAAAATAAEVGVAVAVVARCVSNGLAEHRKSHSKAKVNGL